MEPTIEILTDEDLGNGCHLIKARGPLAHWTMERAGDDEPLFPSIPLAFVLGYARVRKFHELIRRIYPTEIEVPPHHGAKPADGDSHKRPTMGRYALQRELERVKSPARWPYVLFGMVLMALLRTINARRHRRSP